jgi:hypothetical protein
MTKKQYKRLLKKLREIQRPDNTLPVSGSIYPDINTRINALASALESILHDQQPKPEPSRETPPWALQALPKGHPERY